MVLEREARKDCVLIKGIELVPFEFRIQKRTSWFKHHGGKGQREEKIVTVTGVCPVMEWINKY